MVDHFPKCCGRADISPITSLRESTLADLLDQISTNHMLSVIDFALAPRDAKPVKEEITP